MKTKIRAAIFSLLVIGLMVAGHAARPYYGYPSHREATGNKVFIFDPNWLTWAAYDSDGRLVNTGRASGGSKWCRDLHSPCRTVSGVFRVFNKGTAACRSSKFPRPHGGAPMPYCMHFHKGFAIHGSNAVPNYNASHGCIRVPVSDAHWLSKNFISTGTTVVVRPYRS